jgi:hypothetical protein
VDLKAKKKKLYRLNLALLLIGQFMWAEQLKRYNGNTIIDMINENKLLVAFRIVQIS